MIKFYNIRSKETRKCETEPMIAAFWATSDRSPNAQNGQDFGWRLAPEVVVQMRQIMKSEVELARIATMYNLPLEDVTETSILRYISSKNAQSGKDVKDSPEDFEKEYEDKIRELEDEDKTVTPSKDGADKVESKSKTKQEK